MHRLGQLFEFMQPFRRRLLTALIFAGLLTLIGMAPPLLMRRLLNDVARQGNWEIFPLIAALLFVVPVLRAVVNVANTVVLNTISLGIISTTRQRIFKHLMSLSMRFYDDMPVGGISQRLMGDVGTVSSVVTGGMINLVVDSISLLFAVVVMLRLNLSLSVITLALLPLMYANYRFFSKRIQDSTKVLRTRMDHISSMLQERLSAHELIQAYGQDRTAATHFNSQAKQIMDAAVRGSSYSISFNQMSAFINKLGNTTIYCYGCYLFVKGNLGYGDVVAFCAYATQLLGPVVRFSALANQLAQAGVSVDRINEILKRPPAIREAEEPLHVTHLDGDIHVHGLTFGYHDEPVLEDVELCIPAGTHVGIVGRTGAGRSTLARLLRRFYDPDAGAIEVDDTDIRQYNLREYRASMALVLSESTIFDGSIRENLCYGKADADDDTVLAASRAVGLHDLVKDLKHGYDTRLGTGGLVLSAGDRQRLGIARALISGPLVLVTDEATAILDPESAHEINQALRRAMAGKTYVYIVNRVLLAQEADHVVVLDQGRVAEQGAHDDLARRQGGLYRAIFAKQYGEEQLPPAVDEVE